MEEPGSDLDAQPDAAAMRGAAGPLLRRIRRVADLSQRELARALGVSNGVVGDAERGHRDVAFSLLARAAELAGLRLALLDTDGREVAGMTDDAVRDEAGRRYPAHLDVRYGDVGWWYGEHRYDREQPWYTFDRSRDLRDRWRGATGTPEDHQQPQPGDSPRERTRARAEAARARAAAARERATEQLWARRAERARLGLPEPPDPLEFDCSCPAGCDALLLADLPPGDPWHRPQLHVDGCPCGCDIS